MEEVGVNIKRRIALMILAIILENFGLDHFVKYTAKLLILLINYLVTLSIQILRPSR